jgi:hypothetical protein
VDIRNYNRASCWINCCGGGLGAAVLASITAPLLISLSTGLIYGAATISVLPSLLENDTFSQ